MIGRGVPRGAISPTQPVDWKPGSADSAMVGRSGVWVVRFGPAVARPRSCPERMNGSVAASGVSVNWASLVTVAVTDAPPPLYGTWIASVPLASRNCTPARWLCEPAPAEAMLSRPGEALSRPISSFVLFAATEGCTTSTFCVIANSDTGTRSTNGSNESFFCSSGAITWVAVAVPSSV